MKNFKKVISVVMALAMIISSFTAVSASKFADVADTAAYAEAVEVLSALGAVNGVAQENGTFNFEPEKLVTRAEAATMIVGALDMADDAKASAGASQFGDVNSQAAWAAGYVNVGVAQGFIAGYDAAAFGPLDNVTYAQMCVMLTKITGYGEYAQAYGGWPTGYTTMAATAGINKGVAVANDTALTKGQVAMMIWNALQAPMLGVKTYTVSGNEYAPLDGTGENPKWKTLFSEKFNGYTATVTIVATPMAATADYAAKEENDEMIFDIERADWWEELKAPVNGTTKDSDRQGIDGRFLASVDVNGNFMQTGKAAFVLDEDDDVPVMIYFAPTGKVDTKEVAADTYYPQAKLAAGNKFDTTNKIRFGSSYYKFTSSINLYVNGVSYGKITSSADLDKYLYNAKGTVKMVKGDDKVNYFDTLFINYYQIAEVGSVKVTDDDVTITIKDIREKIEKKTLGTKIVITNELVEEGETIVSVKRNGEVADLKSLVKGDIIAYATDFSSESKGLEDPKVIDIIATNDAATGIVKKADNKNLEYTIGEVVYKLVDKAPTPVVGESLELVLDPFGRIFYSETDGTTAKYAIVLKYDSDDDKVTLLLSDGTSKTYEFDSLDTIADLAAIKAIDGATAIESRIVTYKVKNSNGKLTALELVKDLAIESLEYLDRTSKLGGKYTIVDSTPVIDATEADVAKSLAKYASSYSVFDNSSFADGTNYKVVAIKDKAYVAFVVVTEVGSKFGPGIRFAVVKEAAIDHIEDGDECDLMTVLYDGEEQPLLVNDGVAKDLAVGDAFFFETDADGFVKKVYKTYSKPEFAYDADADAYLETKASVFTQIKDIPGVDESMLPTSTKGWSYTIWDGNTDLQLAQGVITDVRSDYVEFASLTQVKTGNLRTDVDLVKEGDGVTTYTIADDAVAYVYYSQDDAADDEDKLMATDVASISASDFSDFQKSKTEKDIFEGIDFSYANEALVMIVDGEIVAIYVIEK